MNFLVPGNPLPKQRPRMGKGGRFYSPSTQEEKRIAGHLQAQMGRNEPCGSDIAVTVRFYRANRRRADLDNLLKNLLDAANGVVWDDDWQIKQIQARMQVDKDAPRTELEVKGIE